MQFIPYLNFDGHCAEAMAFYAQLFGGQIMHQMRFSDMPPSEGMPPLPPEAQSRLMHAHLTVNGASLMMHDDFPEYSGSAMSAPTGVTLHLHVDDTDAWYTRAIDAGASSTLEPHDAFWGDRYAQVKDPFGHLWSIGGPIKGETT